MTPVPAAASHVSARSLTFGIDPPLSLFVISTTHAGTRAALYAAELHSRGLSPSVILVVPHVVGYPESLADNAVLTAIVRGHAASFASDAADTGMKVTVIGAACRSLSQVPDALPLDALVLIGGRPGPFGWRTAPERLAEAIRRSGRQSLFVPTSRPWATVNQNDALQSGSGGQSVADPWFADEDLRVSRVHFNLFSELRHQHPQVLRLVDSVAAPDRLEDRAMRQDAVGVSGEQGQQFEFLRRETNFLAAADDAAAVVVDGQVRPLHLPGLGVVLGKHAAQGDADARQQFLGLNGLVT